MWQALYKALTRNLLYRYTAIYRTHVSTIKLIVLGASTINKYYSETDVGNLIKIHRIQYVCYIFEMFCGVSEYKTLLVQ